MLSVDHIRGTFHLVLLNILFVVVRCTFHKMACNPKTAGCSANMVEMLDSVPLTS